MIASANGIAYFAVDSKLTLAELQERYVEFVMQEHGGNKVQVARALGIDRRTLYRMLDRWALLKERAARSASAED